MNRRSAQLLGAAALAALTLQPVTALADPPPHAQNDKRYDHRDDPWSDDHCYEDRDHGDRYRRDERWQNYDPRRSDFVYRLPPRTSVVQYRGDRYYYGGSQWYRPYRSGYRVTVPPIGLVVSFRPEYDAIVRYGGVPYYRAGPVYYVWHPKARGYVVTDRPAWRW